MMTVHEISELTGLTIRTLQYYDKIGLLKPASYTDSGYRLYGDTEIERLQDIMLFRELEFPLKDIIKILENPEFDRSKAISQQFEMLKLKREHIDDLIIFAKKFKTEEMIWTLMPLIRANLKNTLRKPRKPGEKLPPMPNMKKSPKVDP